MPSQGKAVRWIAVADLHGHASHFERLLHYCRAQYAEAWSMCTLGDYVDNGPEIPRLLELLIELKRELGDRFQPILGNHDLALLRTLGWPAGGPDESWYAQWRGYWNPGGSTPAAYGADNAAELAQRMPRHHVSFLEGLPWFFDTGDFLFVHAGMEPGPLEPQMAALGGRTLPAKHLHLPPALRDKALSTTADPAWSRLVVSAHNRHLKDSRFEGPQRICLSAAVDTAAAALYAVVLPERRWLRVDGHRVSGVA